MGSAREMDGFAFRGREQNRSENPRSGIEGPSGCSSGGSWNWNADVAYLTAAEEGDQGGVGLRWIACTAHRARVARPRVDLVGFGDPSSISPWPLSPIPIPPPCWRACCVCSMNSGLECRQSPKLWPRQIGRRLQGCWAVPSRSWKATHGSLK